MLGKKAKKVMGMNAATRDRKCWRDGCGKVGVGTGSTRCLPHLEEETISRRKKEG